MKAIVITDNNYRGLFVKTLLNENQNYIRKFMKELIAQGKAKVFDVKKGETIAKAWLDLGEIVFGKTEKIKVILI